MRGLDPVYDRMMGADVGIEQLQPLVAARPPLSSRHQDFRLRLIADREHGPLLDTLADRRRIPDQVEARVAGEHPSPSVSALNGRSHPCSKMSSPSTSR